MHAVAGAENGSPREIFKLAYQTGFLKHADIWLLMLKKRNLSVPIYNEAEIDELLVLIRDSFLPAFEELADVLKEKTEEIENEDWKE